MMKKTLIAAVLAALAAALLTTLCACGGRTVSDPETTDSSSDGQTDTKENTPSDSEPVPASEPDTQTAADPDTQIDTEPVTEGETLSPDAQGAFLRELMSRPAGGKDDVRSFGTTDVPGDALDGVRREIAALEAEGRKAAFMLLDLDGSVGLCYNADWKTTSQSTIKAPYITSVLDKRPSVLESERSLIKPTIRVSDNDTYAELRSIYGKGPISSWCHRAGISLALADASYPRIITVRDMAKLWTLMNQFFDTHPEMDEYIGWFYGSAFSAIYNELGDQYLTRTKAGWESGLDEDNPEDYADPYAAADPRFTDGDPLNDETATNDTGIVYAGDHPYILVIFTDVSSNYGKLQPLVRALHEVHETTHSR